MALLCTVVQQLSNLQVAASQSAAFFSSCYMTEASLGAPLKPLTAFFGNDTYCSSCCCSTLIFTGLYPHTSARLENKRGEAWAQREIIMLPDLGQSKTGFQVSSILNQHPSHFILFLSTVCSTNHVILQRTHKDEKKSGK